MTASLTSLQHRTLGVQEVLAYTANVAPKEGWRDLIGNIRSKKSL